MDRLGAPVGALSRLGDFIILVDRVYVVYRVYMVYNDENMRVPTCREDR